MRNQEPQLTRKKGKWVGGGNTPYFLMNGDIVPFNANEKDLKEEVNYRNWKAGYTTKLGECRRATKIMGTIFWGKEKLNVWPRDKNGNLID